MIERTSVFDAFRRCARARQHYTHAGLTERPLDRQIGKWNGRPSGFAAQLDERLEDLDLTSALPVCSVGVEACHMQTGRYVGR